MKVAFHYRNFGIPPNAGGQRDQPLGWLDRMSMALGYYNVTKAYLAAKNKAQWADENPDAWEWVAQVRTLQRKRDKQNGSR